MSQEDTGAVSGSVDSSLHLSLSGTASSSGSSHESSTSSASSQVLVPTLAEHLKDSAGGGEKEYFCGIGKCRPKWMQVVFRNSKSFTLILCLQVIIEGALVSGNPVVAELKRGMVLP